MPGGVKDSKRSASGRDSRRDRWRQHRIERRAELVQAALRALEKHGPDFAMDDVAAEAGVTKPVLYRHFADKADLHRALGQLGTQRLFDRLLPALRDEAAPLPRIRGAIDAFFRTVEGNPKLYLLFVNPVQLGDRLPDSDIVRQDKELIATTIAALLGDYLRAFNLDSNAAEPWAHGVVGLVQNVGHWWLAERSMSRERVVDYTTELIWAAIDGTLRSHGIVIEPDQPLEVRPTATNADC